MRFEGGWRRALGGAAMAALLGTGAVAQEEETSTNRVGTETDWSVFVDESPTECWAVSQPRETVNTRDGRVVAVRRGDILLMVFYRPSANVEGQVTFTGGYPFAADSAVSIEISGSTFELYTPSEDDPATPVNEREWAWPESPEQDAAIVAAMKRGAQAVLTGRSSRGTTTQDTFSLMGFTAAITDAEQRCTSG